MSKSKLPDRASLEYLKKLAKDRLKKLRQTNPKAKLSTALLAVAREYGFSSWRALKEEIDSRRSKAVDLFFAASEKGGVEQIRTLLATDPGLVRIANPGAAHGNWTALHSAAQAGQAEVVRLLLEQGADPNTREDGDHTYALHWAAAKGNLEIVRLLLDAGTDVHGVGDDHALDVIGWATVFREPGITTWDVASLLVDRGARHHIFSAIAVGDLKLIRKVVKHDPQALQRRQSRFENGQTALHFAMSRQRYDILDLLIELGADLEAEDQDGQTAFKIAILRGDREAMSRLHTAGAKEPAGWKIPRKRLRASFSSSVAKMADSIRKSVPMIRVPDVGASLSWYTSIGFKEVNRYEDEGQVQFGMMCFGRAEFMLVPGGKKGEHEVSLFFYTSAVDELYQILKAHQLDAVKAAIAAEPGHEAIEFVQDIYNPPYGGREFGIRDLNGYVLNFLQPEVPDYLRPVYDQIHK
jgi:ankyrin repeat protein